MLQDAGGGRAARDPGRAGPAQVAALHLPAGRIPLFLILLHPGRRHHPHQQPRHQLPPRGLRGQGDVGEEDRGRGLRLGPQLAGPLAVRLLVPRLSKGGYSCSCFS